MPGFHGRFLLKGGPVGKPLKSPNMFRVAAFILLKYWESADLIPAFVCKYSCVYEYIQVCIWRLEDNVRCHYSALPTLFVLRSSLTGLELPNSHRLAGQ